MDGTKVKSVIGCGFPDGSAVLFVKLNGRYGASSCNPTVGYTTKLGCGGRRVAWCSGSGGL